MTTGFEPVPSALTGQCTGLLCYVTMFLRSGTWIRTRRDGLTVRSFAVNEYRNEKCRALPSNTGRGARRAFVARAGFEPSDLGLMRAAGTTELPYRAVTLVGLEPILRGLKDRDPHP